MQVRTWSQAHWDFLALTVVAVGVRLVFVLFTDRVWEDALITIAHAKNAVAGVGLTHHAGEGPTHGFTSALSVLIPLAGELVAPDAGLLTLRMASLLAAIAALWFGWHLAVLLGLSGAGRFLVLGFLTFEQNHIFYGMAGMETQVAVAILLAGFTHAIAGNVWRAGTAAGLAVLARPEFLILLVPFLLMSAWISVGRRATVQVGAVAGLVAAPWIAFTSLYYGTPMPHTIIAKAESFSTLPSPGTPVPEVLLGVVAHFETLGRTFMPFYADTKVVSAPLPFLALASVASVMIVAILIGLIDARRERPWWGLGGFLIVYTAYRVVFLPTSYFDWYVPPVTAVAVFFVARGLGVMLTGRSSRWMATGAIVALFAMPIPGLMTLERRIQEVEELVRRPVAQYLSEHVAIGEPVVAEAAGYFGESGVLLWDFPGLTSPAALSFTQRIPREDRSVSALVAISRPRWAVLRPRELDDLQLGWPEEARRFDICLDIGPGGESLGVGDMRKHSIDLRFLILRRDGCPTPDDS